MRVSIIGGGIVGCSIALDLARRGLAVNVIDRNGDVGHGTTSASTAIVRRFYSQPEMVALAHEASYIWADWSSYIGPVDDDLAVFHRTGMLFVPPRIDDGVRGIVAEMERLGIRVSILSADETAQRFPYLETASHFPPKRADAPDFFKATGQRIDGAIFEVDAGYVVSPGLATQNLRSAGEREGARFLLRHKVVEIQKLDAGGFRLLTERGESIDSEVVVNASGPHSGIINRLAGVKLPLETRPLRQEVHALENPLFDTADGSSPPAMGDLDGGVYFRPESGGRDILVGSTEPECDGLEWIEDPDDYNDGITETWWQRQSLRLMKRFPRVQRGRARGLASLYDVTVKDWYPIVDRTDLPGYYVCIGTSGSSFKTAPVLGQLMGQIIEACEGGQDTDKTPLHLTLARIGTSIETRFLSRLRDTMASMGNVIG